MTSPGQDSPRRLKVILSIDTEVYPMCPDWKSDRLLRDLERDVYGRTEGAESGLLYQLDCLRRYHLKASFFVEPLFASSDDVGFGPLETIVGQIQDAGQEVQMHLHPEWTVHLPANIKLRERKSAVLNRFAAEDQRTLLAIALSNLKRCGAARVCAFRAGDFAANLDTLAALVDLGIPIDASYNPCYLGKTCGLDTGATLLEPATIGGICELPMTFFEDRPGHRRRLQLCACSTKETIRALEQAHSAGWGTFVFLSHSFEALGNRWVRGAKPRHRPQVTARWERLCAYLAGHRDVYETVHVADLDPSTLAVKEQKRPLRGSLALTARRLLEQAWTRLGDLTGRM